MRILTTGIKEIDVSMFHPVRVWAHTLNKPESGCLWGSTERKNRDGSVYSDWKEWTYYEEFKDFDYGLSYTLNRNARVLDIPDLNTYAQILAAGYALEEADIFGNFNPYLDFRKVQRDFDAVHVSAKAVFESKFYTVLSPFGGYDVESWIIFRPEAINMGSVLTRNNVKVA